MTWTMGWTWTDDRVVDLKKWFTEGLSASQIAKEFGSITRNAVIGKLTRLGLTRRAIGPSPLKRVRAPKKPRQTGTVIRLRKRPTGGLERRAEPVFDTAPLPDMVEPIIPMEQRCSVLDLNNTKCRWPIGDPQESSFFFCGAVPADGFVYCHFHAVVAHTPARARRDAAWRGRV